MRRSQLRKNIQEDGPIRKSKVCRKIKENRASRLGGISLLGLAMLGPIAGAIGSFALLLFLR